MRFIPNISLTCLLFLTGCFSKTCILEPDVVYVPTERCIRNHPPAFDPLTFDELQTDWGKELKLGMSFAQEFDLYRAITCYKSALILMPKVLCKEEKTSGVWPCSLLLSRRQVSRGDRYF